MDEIPKNWTWAQNKLQNMFVQNLMKDVKEKVREFGRLEIKKVTLGLISTENFNVNVKKLSRIKLPLPLYHIKLMLIIN